VSISAARVDTGPPSERRARLGASPEELQLTEETAGALGVSAELLLRFADRTEAEAAHRVLEKTL
jgi:hypothetical protein